MPDESCPGEHAFALVVYTGDKGVGVRSLSRGEIRDNWHTHVFAWQAIEYPGFTVEEAGMVYENWKLYRDSKEEPNNDKKFGAGGPFGVI